MFVTGNVTGNLAVTLVIYSGLPDPEWDVLESDPDYSQIQILLSNARADGFVFSPEATPAKLGYKGFLVRDASMVAQLIVGSDTIPLQQQLLASMPRAGILISDYFRQGIMEIIRSGTVSAEGGGPRRKRAAPVYNPALWNNNAFTRLNNNCYNYANDIITNTFAQPGRGSGQIFNRPLNGPNVRDAAIRDGLQVLAPHPGAADPVPVAPVGPRHLAALFIAPG